MYCIIITIVIIIIVTTNYSCRVIVISSNE